MNTERLLRLADLVETIPPEKFDLADYWQHPCGTIYCGLGWAGHDEWFQNEGLRFEIAGWWNTPIPVFNGLVNFDAVTAFFELASDFGRNTQAEFLFSKDSYVTRPAHPSEVAIRIRLFIEHHDEKVVREPELV